ncbi:porin family protein [Mucilaginibacter arboris]|uniref:Outer membrane beta-barrel protein n=1 Tax=Mucilaginibacter arboris TaxID=2682090 RepID=A0A7K1SYG4_9SPHI|nr:porin family protein [Mucilaginibacter arboris]MVN22297.1 outer membrane beta-barrel protein [Mucilaginibacter arboris]
MMLKKCTLIFISLFLLFQTLKAQTVKIGAKAGINFASISAYNNPTSSTYQSKNYSNFRIGGTTELEWPKFTIQTGLMLDGKGGENTYINPETSTNRRKNARLYYLEVPVSFLYRKSTKIGTLFLGGGPYVAYGLWGNYTLSGIIFDSPIDGSEKVAFGNNENSDYKRTDYGLNFRAEIRLLHGIGFELNYEYGLRDIATPGLYDDVNIKTRNKVFGIAVSYLIKNN